MKNFFKFIDKILFNLLTKLYQIFYRNFYKKIIFYIRINKNNNCRNICYFNNLKNDLSMLCEKHGSDKGYINFKKDTP